MEKLNMKTPITYYGGKQKMARIIVPLIAEHKLYCEPFCGGAAIFFAKEKSELEVLNDTNRELINFYQVVKNDFTSLEKEIRITLNSRDLYRKASVIYNNPDMFSEVRRAWALWVLSTQSFGAQLDNSWGFDKVKNHTAKKIKNARENFSEELAIRLQDVQIECADACYIIRSRDTEDSFFYCDPPYYNANMGHYDGYSLADYTELLETLSKIKGKFLLSSYPSDVLCEYVAKHSWYTKSFDMRISVNAKADTKNKRKVEVLTANYDLKMY
jgi:DNA adenine methylase